MRALGVIRGNGIRKKKIKNIGVMNCVTNGRTFFLGL